MPATSFVPVARNNVHHFWENLFDTLPGFSLMWLMHLLPALVPGVYWCFSRSKVRWTWWDFGMLIVPFWTLFLLFLTSPVDKGWGNVGLEPLLLGVLVAGTILARMIFWPGGLPPHKAMALELACLGFAFLLHFSVPALHSN